MARGRERKRRRSAAALAELFPDTVVADVVLGARGGPRVIGASGAALLAGVILQSTFPLAMTALGSGIAIQLVFGGPRDVAPTDRGLVVLRSTWFKRLPAEVLATVAFDEVRIGAPAKGLTPVRAGDLEIWMLRDEARRLHAHLAEPVSDGG